MQATIPERQRLIDSKERRADWKHWGPYVADRAWGTVREDYSANGDAWNFFPHDHARSRAYRWNEDGLAGFCNRFQNVCLAVAFWNERDPFLKERLFGLTGPEGNHAEDVKEYYFYLDGTPTHSYMKMLYKYPQVEFPYQRLVDENQKRDRHALEFELIDALPEVFAQNRYFDIFIEYAKAGQDDILCRIHAINRGPDAAPLHILPHLWFRNTWSWGYGGRRPEITTFGENGATFSHRHLGERFWHVAGGAGHSSRPRILFTENETNMERLFGHANGTPYVKDGIHEAVVHGRMDRVNPAQKGSKVAAHFQAMVAPGEEYTVCVRFAQSPHAQPFGDFDDVFQQRIREADDFYASFQNSRLTDEEKMVQRQAFAGLCWTKQFYHYSVELWLDGDPAGPPPPPSRNSGRNADWTHVYNLDVLAVPDKWEYPWCAAWDVAFNMIPTAIIDPEWAKRQLILQLREWYMHPNGQIAAYEWNFSDVNPPVHAWAVWRVYKIDRKITGKPDTQFLEQAFHKLLLNFTWWVNKVDAQGRNIFQGGFLGMDNIGVFDRSAPLPTGGYLEQADGTAWMGMYCLNMLAIALELARTRPAYEDVATKFFEHFIYIANAINSECGAVGLWDEEDGFFYDMVQMPDGQPVRLKVRSFVGLIPLFAVETLEPDILDQLPHFRRRMEWFIQYRPNLVKNIASLAETGEGGRRLLTIVDRKKLERVLPRMLDSAEFFSDYGLRSMSKQHGAAPFECHLNGSSFTVRYEPAESSVAIFGGNSNWRGPIWFPVNFLMLESLQKYHHYFGDTLKVELPTHSERWANLAEVAQEISRRLIRIFLADPFHGGRRAVFGGTELFQTDPHWRDHIPFYEYFHAEIGAGLGASHQTGWTALVAKLLQQSRGSILSYNTIPGDGLVG